MKHIKNIVIILWRRHHFLIPPKYWGRYLKKIKDKICNKKEFLDFQKSEDYNIWLNSHDVIDLKPKKYKYNPLISFIIPVYNIEPQYLSDCLDSILNQTYTNFEVCLADDCSTKEETLKILKYYEEKDARIKVVYRKTNGHISKATNSALEITKGDFVALMDDDDTLAAYALEEIIKVINNNRDVDFIYSDEDKLSMDGVYCEPHFKTDFALDSFYGGNYICHFTVIKKDLLNKIGNFKSEYVGAQDFDLFLRATEQAKHIYHIPKILYHWRKVPGSTADTIGNKVYAIENGKKAVEDSLKRRGCDAYVTIPIQSTHYVVHYKVKNNPKVTVIMLDVNNKIIKYNLKQFEKIDSKNIEFIANIDSCNNSNIICSKLNINDLINKATGEYILITYGKIKIYDKDLLKDMIGYASQKEIALVGPKIYNFNKLIKSAGQILSEEYIYLDAFENHFIDSLGYYGRLIVPYDYSALSSKFFMIEKSKFNKVKGFMTDINFNYSTLDFCLKLLKEGYRNVLLSHLYISQKDLKEVTILEEEKDIIRNKWDLKNDKYYNINLSTKKCFMLDGGEDSEK